jgi:hypothetical protein
LYVEKSHTLEWGKSHKNGNVILFINIVNDIYIWYLDLTDNLIVWKELKIQFWEELKEEWKCFEEATGFIMMY